jgi:glycosyltransferase involved in cell wall biosynthesis
MKILFLTQYYPPEVGAPQNRLHELAVRLKKKGIDVEVLTAMPNYPNSEIREEYKGGRVKEENIDGVQVYRSGIYVSKSTGIISRLLNYFSFVWTSYWRGRKLGNYDYLLVESPPLFLGYSAMRLSKRLKAKMIFNVSDLWPESAEKMGVVTNSFLLKMAYRLEAKCYRRAALVTGQTQGIVDNIEGRFPQTRTYWLPNGVDLSFYEPSKIDPVGFRKKLGVDEKTLLLFYGGIVGHAQGLQLILQAADRLRDVKNVQFVIQGSGPEKDGLLRMKDDLGLSNVTFLPPVDKKKMPGILKEVDVALVPLRKLDIFKGAIPSKIFEALAMKKALLLGVDGEARTHFIERGKAGLYFEPENVEALVDSVRKLALDPSQIIEMGENAREYVRNHFDRNTIAYNFIEELKAIHNN